MKRKKSSRRSAARLSTLDDFLSQEGKLEEFEAVAVKEALAGQIAKGRGPDDKRRRAIGVARSQR